MRPDLGSLRDRAASLFLVSSPLYSEGSSEAGVRQSFSLPFEPCFHPEVADHFEVGGCVAAESREVIACQ